MLDCHLKYGEVLHVWLYHIPVVYTSNICAVRRLMNNPAHIKPRWVYFSLRSAIGQRFLGQGMLTNSDHSSWEKRHKSIRPGFQRRYLKCFLPTFNRIANKFVDRLLDIGKGGAPIAMKRMLEAFALEVIAGVAFDEHLDSINNPNHVLKKSLVDALHAVFQMMKSPFKTLLNWQVVNQTREHCKRVRNVGTDIIKRRLKQYSCENANSKDDILDFIIRSAADDPTVTMEDMVDEFVTIFVAGHDTTATVLSFALERIILRPAIWKKMFDEIEMVLQERDDVEFDDLANMEYIGCVFKEILRLYPPTGCSIRTLSEEMTIAGYKLSPGVDVAAPLFVMHRFPDHWEKPLEFNPDRFRYENNSDLQAFMPFALGPRICVGRHFAEMEFKVLFAKMLKRINFTLLEGQKNGVIAEALLFTPLSDINCTIQARV